MFICNFKLNKTNFFKGILIIMTIICIALCIVGIYNISHSNKEFETFNNGNCMPPSDEIAYLTDKNYTNILKEVHENLDKYIGQKISYTGYVYRVSDFSDDKFVLARDMSINNSNQTVVVGFLCKLSNAKDYEDYTWVKVTGKIEKDYYLGDIPCIYVEEIEKIDKPENCIVPEPSENFIETSVIY